MAELDTTPRRQLAKLGPTYEALDFMSYCFDIMVLVRTPQGWRGIVIGKRDGFA